MKRHPTPENNLAPTQRDIPLTPKDLEDSGKLILVARAHFATAFPNERRKGCPSPGMIQKTRAGQPPDDETRSHLFRCSECFNEYGAALRDYYRQAAPGAARAAWGSKLADALFRLRLPSLAVAIASLVVAAGLFIQWRHQTTATQSVLNRSQPPPEASAGNPLTPMPRAMVAEQPAGAGQEKPSSAEPLVISLNLNRYRALGDSTLGDSLGDLKEGARIKLPPRVALLKLRLRRGSRAGLYQISVVDPNSKPLAASHAHSSDGKSLDAAIDLRRAARTAHRLRVERGDDMNEYLVEIAGR